MATFPSITPSYAGFSKRSNPNKRRVRFQDGYEHRILFGLASHQNPKIYSLIFDVTETESDVIEAFLDSRANDQASFTFTPPAEGISKTGTYSQSSSTTITVTITNHGIAVGETVTIDYTSGSASSSWYGNTAANMAKGHTVNIADSTSNTWYMTGFQVETGSVHTDFEHRSYADEIRLCRRYFCKYVGALNINFVNEHPNNTAGYLHFPFYEEMRASPTITLGNSVNIARPQVSVSQKVQSVADISPNCFNVIGWSGQGSLGSTGDAYYRMSLSEGDANSTISCNAEL